MCKSTRSAAAAIVTALRCLLRGLPWFLAARPKTPLRVLCVIAFDVLHRFRYRRPLPRSKVKVLAALLDFGACANAICDGKSYCRREFQSTRRRLEDSGLSTFLDEYLLRLEVLERERPVLSCGTGSGAAVKAYREAVVRLSLGVVAASVFGKTCLADGIRSLDENANLQLVFRLVMECQLIDDVWDYSRDCSAGLPSFMTAFAELRRAMAFARSAAVDYADLRHLPRGAEQVPWRLALRAAAIGTRMIIWLACWRERINRWKSGSSLPAVRRAEVI